MRSIRHLLPLALLAWAAAAPAAEPVSLRLRQAVPDLPAIRVYVDARDAAGQAATGLAAARLSATVGAQTARVEGVEPLDQSAEGVAYVFLVDVSKSLRPRQFARMKQAMDQWIGGLSGKDRAALMSFGETVRVV